MNATDIRLMEAPDEICVRLSAKADALARERAYEAAQRVCGWAYAETDVAARCQLSGLVDLLEDADSEADVETLLRHAVYEMTWYGDRHQDVIEEVLRPIVRACEGVR